MSIEFAYAQARIQARTGRRLSAAAWQSLEASQDLSHYLHAVRGTSLKASVQHLNESADAHLIERSLHEDWRLRLQQLSNWVPKRWRAAMLWVRTLPELPALAHLLAGGRVRRWMQDEPVLQPVTSAEPEARWQALSLTELAPLAGPAAGDVSLAAAWQAHWRSLWPAVPAQLAGLDQLGQTLAGHLRLMAGEQTTTEDAAQRRESLERRLLKLIRVHRERPAAMFSYLGLLALDLQRLRGGLLRRASLQTVARE